MNIYVIIHQDKFDETTHHKAFDSLQLAEDYENQLKESEEAKWIEMRKFNVYSQDDVILTPRREEQYWDMVYEQTRKRI